MKCLVYADNRHDSSQRLWREVSLIRELEAQKVGTHSGFIKEMKRWPRFQSILVFNAVNASDLDFIVSKKDQLFGFRLILILPDNSEEMISRGHLLHPRYMAQPGGNFKDITAVLHKMANNGGCLNTMYSNGGNILVKRNGSNF